MFRPPSSRRTAPGKRGEVGWSAGGRPPLAPAADDRPGADRMTVVAEGRLVGSGRPVQVGMTGDRVTSVVGGPRRDAVLGGSRFRRPTGERLWRFGLQQ